MSKLLINENPIMIIPSLAMKLGVNEAVVVQQIHYWLVASPHEIEGRKWVYNTYKEWQIQIPFWSESTIKRTIKSLEEQGILISANFNRSKLDKTKWYSIDYEKLEELDDDLEQSPSQIEPSGISDWAMEETPLTKAIPEITTETTTEINIPFSEVIHYLNENTFLLQSWYEENTGIDNGSLE